MLFRDTPPVPPAARFLLAPGVLLAFVSLSAQEGLLDLPVGYRQEIFLDLDPGVDFALQVGGLCYGPEGEPIVYEDASVRLLADGGTQTLATFDPPVVGSFLVLAPGAQSVIFGENTDGSIHSVALDGSGPTFIGRIPSNFDLDVAPPEAPEPIRARMYVSALGKENLNSIYLLDPAAKNPADEVVTMIPTFSGPLAFDDVGNLYYVTASFDPPPVLARFRPEQLEAGVGEGAVDFSQAEVVLSDIDGAFDLEWCRGELYLTNLGFASGVGSIDVVDTERNFLYSVFATLPSSAGIVSPTFLAVAPGSEDFAPGAGDAGGGMLVHYSDFSTLSHVVEVVPRLYFVRGELNGDGELDLSDAIYLLRHLFLGGPPPRPAAAADINADGLVDLADPIYLLDFLFRGGPTIPEPFPEPGPGG